jgi:hypothetical protein
LHERFGCDRIEAWGSLLNFAQSVDQGFLEFGSDHPTEIVKTGIQVGIERETFGYYLSATVWLHDRNPRNDLVDH